MNTVPATRSLSAVLPLFLLMACHHRSSDLPPEDSLVREQPTDEAIEMTTAPQDARFCCDPAKPFPQKVGTITLSNTNKNPASSSISVRLNVGAGSSSKVDARPGFVTLKSGESKTVDIVALTCDFESETMKQCDVVLPLSHSLESWGDSRPRASVLSVIQPMIEPIFDTRSNGDALIGLMAEVGSPASHPSYQE